MSTVTWARLLASEMEAYGESFDDVEGSTLTEEELYKQFDSGYGGTEGCAFTVWTHKRVYFPACYDGSEWVASVPRNPCDEKTGHVGGG